MSDPKTLSARDARLIAAHANGLDPRTVVARWRGARQSPVIRAAIDAAAREVGINPPGVSPIADTEPPSAA